MRARYKWLYRFSKVLLLITPIFIGVSIILYLLKGKLAFYYTTSELISTKPLGIVKLGGKVTQFSLINSVDSENAASIQLVLTDTKTELTVQYQGPVPLLLRVNQGVVATGSLKQDGVFIAQELLIKHDEYYYPKPT